MVGGIVNFILRCIKKGGASPFFTLYLYCLRRQNTEGMKSRRHRD